MHSHSLKPRKAPVDHTAFVYIVPLFLFLGVFIYYGIGYNMYISLFHWDGLSALKFIGLQNYADLFRDADFWTAVRHSLVFTVVCVPVAMALGFLFAVLLSSMDFGANLFKSIYFLPNVMAIIVIGVTFQMIYEPNSGLLETLLGAVGLGQWNHGLLANPHTAIYGVAAAYIFTQVGFFMLIYFTSILNIDTQIFEAAKLDGAGLLRQNCQIVFPMLAGTHITLSILGIVAALRVFDLVWIMTQGGPGGSTELLSTYLFRKAMLEYNVGYSSAISVILLFLSFGYAMVQMKIYHRVRS